MSIKRRATTDLNHENWDQEEKDEKEMGSYKIASDDVLEKRVIKTANRRFPNAGEEAKAPVFSGFGGFNKTQPSSFDFLANLTNVSQPDTTGTATSNTATPSNVSSNLFGNTSSNTTLVASTTTTSPTIGTFTTESTSVFGAPAASSTASIFTSPTTDSATPKDNPFKSPVTSSFAINSSNSKPEEDSNAQTKPSITFGATSSSSEKSVLTTNASTQSVEILVSTTSVQTINSDNISNSEASKTSNSTVQKVEENLPQSKINYYTKLRGLNLSLSSWVNKHVEGSGLCILTPIFEGYEVHLKKILEEFEREGNAEKLAKDNSSKTNEEPTAENLTTSARNLEASQSLNATSSNTPKSIFGVQTQSIPNTQSQNISFGFTSTPGTNATTSGFSFGGSSTQITSTPTSPIVSSNSTLTTNTKATFSFGSNAPFSFNSNVQVQQPAIEKGDTNNDAEDEPPKVEFTPIVEENSVFDKRCKIFIKKDGNFVDKGVGTLYIKKIQDSEKHQLLVRANTNLGNVLLNLVLSSAIPIQLMGKNNVMMVCIPNPEAKPPPVPILIRVKTAEEAEELLNTLNKYKA